MIFIFGMARQCARVQSLSAEDKVRVPVGNDTGDGSCAVANGDTNFIDGSALRNIQWPTRRAEEEHHVPGLTTPPAYTSA
jgi:hypothetical protein